MKKLTLLLLLMFVVSGTVYSGEKEYTFKSCKGVTDINSCDKCKVVGKISFKISKYQDSVLKNMTVLDTGQKGSVVEENCKIFDDETFECKKKIDGNLSGMKTETTFRLMLSNGKWIDTFNVNTPSDTSLYSPEHLSSCGEEIN